MYGSNYTLYSKSNISVLGPSLKMFHALYPQKSRRHMCSNIWWHMWYVFIFVKIDSDYYTNRQFRFKKFNGCMEQQLKTACVSQNLITKRYKRS